MSPHDLDLGILQKKSLRYFEFSRLAEVLLSSSRCVEVHSYLDAQCMNLQRYKIYTLFRHIYFQDETCRIIATCLTTCGYARSQGLSRGIVSLFPTIDGRTPPPNMSETLQTMGYLPR